MQVYQVSEAQFGWIFAFIAAGLIGASQVNSLALRRFSSETIIAGAGLCQSLLGLSFMTLKATAQLANSEAPLLVDPSEPLETARRDAVCRAIPQLCWPSDALAQGQDPIAERQWERPPDCDSRGSREETEINNIPIGLKVQPDAHETPGSIDTRKITAALSTISCVSLAYFWYQYRVIVPKIMKHFG
jgi:hypothetical protein